MEVFLKPEDVPNTHAFNYGIDTLAPSYFLHFTPVGR